MSAFAVTERDARNLRPFTFWILGMAVWFAAATIVLAEGLVAPQPAAWIFPIIGLVIGALMIRAYVRFLREADELLRKIHLEGLALAIGITVVTLPVYRLCERLGAPKLDLVDALLVIVLGWGLGLWRGVRRYATEDAQ